MVGLDVAAQVIASLYEQYQHEPRFRATPLIARRVVAAGLLGRKSGRGFYAYDGHRRIEEASGPAAPPVPDCPRLDQPARAAAHRQAALGAAAGRTATGAGGGSDRPKRAC